MRLKKYNFRWSDMDANMHIKNTAYNEIFTQDRLNWLAEIGYAMDRFKELGIGPMIIHEHMYYIKEVRYQLPVYLNLYLKGNSENSRFVELAQHLYNSDGDLSCYLNLTLSWVDIRARKLVAPPEDMIQKLGELEKTEDYKIIDSSALKVAGIPYGKKVEIRQ